MVVKIPLIKILLFGPLNSTCKIIKIDVLCVCVLNRCCLLIWQLQPIWSARYWNEFKQYIRQSLLILKAMLMMESNACQLFKLRNNWIASKIKKVGKRKLAGVYWVFFLMIPNSTCNLYRDRRPFLTAVISYTSTYIIMHYLSSCLWKWVCKELRSVVVQVEIWANKKILNTCL